MIMASAAKDFYEIIITTQRDIGKDENAMGFGNDISNNNDKR